MIWKTQLDPLAAASVLSSPVVAGTLVIVGTSSSEKSRSSQAGYTPRFRGKIQALDLTSGSVVWSFTTVPPGYTGGAVWGNNIAVDVTRNTVFAGTGNNYTVPGMVSTCLQAAGGNPTKQHACLDPADFVDAVIALDLTTGAPKWAQSTVGFDTWLSACGNKPGHGLPCPTPAGGDADFASQPNLYITRINGRSQKVVGAGQKNGMYWAFDPDTGAILWSTLVGPGGGDGGIKWGSAVDGNAIYVASRNGNKIPFNLGPPANLTGWRGGSWSALNPATGAFLWQVPVGLNAPQPVGAAGAMTVANGVVFAAALSGEFVALDALTGATLWTFNAGGAIEVAPSVVNGHVYGGRVPAVSLPATTGSWRSVSQASNVATLC